MEPQTDPDPVGGENVKNSNQHVLGKSIERINNHQPSNQRTTSMMTHPAKKEMNAAYWTGGIITIFCGIIYYYPIVFYIFLFVIYSILIILISIAVTVWLMSKNRAQASHLPSNMLYNATW